MKHRKRASTSPTTAKEPTTTDQLFFLSDEGPAGPAPFFWGSHNEVATACKADARIKKQLKVV